MSLYEEILAKKDEDKDKWTSLNHICNELDNQLNPNLNNFLNAFCEDVDSILFNLLQYGVLLQFREKERQIKNFIDGPPFLLSIWRPSIKKYLDNDDAIDYFITHNQYTKISRRQDFIYRIDIPHQKLKYRVPFSNISKYLVPSILKEFKIPCFDVLTATGQHKSGLDLIENWNQFDPDDQISIYGDINSKLSFFMKEYKEA